MSEPESPPLPSSLQLYGLVRVVKLRDAPETYDGWSVNKRPPVVGDVGSLVDVLRAPNSPSRYVVECASPTGDGSSEWLSDFAEDELEAVVDEPVASGSKPSDS